MTDKQHSKRLKRALLILAKAFVALVLLSVLIMLLDSALTRQSTSLHILANVLPGLLVWTCLLAITKRFGVSLILASAFIAALFSLNAAKFHHTQQYLIYQDTQLFRQLFQGWDVFVGYLNFWVLIPSIITLIILIRFAWRERPIPIYAALFLFIFSGGALYGISNTPPELKSLYGSLAHGGRPWAANSPVEDQGLIVSLILGARAAHVAPPTYDPALIQAFQKNYPSEPAQQPNKPDIILWLGESFFDPGVIAGVDTCDVLPTFCNLTSKELRGNIEVPTYGGNTTRTEFEVLTAIPFAMLGGRDYPYVTSVHRPFDSIAQTLKQSGYRNIAIHPHHKTFWQRHRALPLLGFDNFLGQKDIKEYQRDGVWISDDSLADQVMQQLDNANEPTFVFAISMEGHGSFGSQDKIDENKVNAIKTFEHVEKKGNRMWQEYIYHARNTAHALDRLKNYIEQRERPTLIVFFGDHLPGLQPLYKQIAFDDGNNAHQQSTPTLAMANYPVGSDWMPHFSYELGLWTLQLAGEIGDSPLQQLLQATALQYKKSDTNLSDTITAMQAQQLRTPYVLQ